MTEFFVAVNDRRSGPFVASAGQTVFPYDFPLFDAADIAVYAQSAGASSAAQLAGSAFTVTGIGAETGGTIVLAAGAAAGTLYSIVGARNPRRATDFAEAGELRASTLNRELDILAQTDQEQAAAIGRSLRLAETDAGLSTVLPTAAARANKAVVFDGAGNVGVSADDYANQTAAVAASAAAAAASATAASGSATSATASAATATAQATNAASSAAAAAASAASIAFPVPIASGGTGATTAAAARTALGLAALAVKSTVATADIDDQAVSLGKLERGATAGQVLTSNGSGAAPSYQTPGAAPTGAIMAFAGSAAPTGWQLCSGAAISRTTFAALFAVLGTTYGAGDGSTTFNLPDMRGRVAAGVDNMGGTAANRITAGGSGIAGTTRGAVGGTETHTLSGAQLPTTAVQGTGAGVATYSCGGTERTYGTPNTALGSGNAHQNTQPTIMLNYIIKE